MGKENKQIQNNKLYLENYSGRQWVKSTLPNSEEQKFFDYVDAMEKREDKYYCNRCNTESSSELPGKIFYCRECIGLGRICQNDFLCRVKEDEKKTAIKFNQKDSDNNDFLTWQGELTNAQAQVSCDLQKSLLENKNHLVHAVTGAGKTEMLFEVVNLALQKEYRICIATPRIDVVNELYPRFCQAFGTIQIGKYHGREYHEPKRDALTICTTHQLLKFYHAFDLVIIDEVDAFPFRDNRVLHFGAENSVKDTGCCFYLTATPTKTQLSQVEQDLLNYSLLKRRFHGYDLPVPKLRLNILPTIIKSRYLNPKFLFYLKKNLKLSKPIMIFVPKIRQLPIYLKILQHYFPNLIFETVYSGDEARLDKVSAFRDGKIDVLLTTTILERGVTIKHVQVFILDADDGIYNQAALVQIAGRVGRAKDDPNGNVYFFYRKYTDEIAEARKQIMEMNNGK